MGLNIKKRSASNIYHGVDRDTGELKHISEVHRGAKCNCNCVVCGERLEARKGEQRRHHFAHDSNYECLYAGEIGVYLMFREMLESIRYILLPPIKLSFPSWKNAEVLKESRRLPIESVEYECEDREYPPMLKVSAAGGEFRVVLDFGRYYDNADKTDLRREAKNKKYSILMFDFPKLDDADFPRESLREEIEEGKNAYWLFSRLEEDKKKKFFDVAREPELNGKWYKCPISVGGVLGANPSRDCRCCKFNVGCYPSCKCMAFAGVCSTKDFDKSAAERLAEMSELREENEKKQQKLQEQLFSSKKKKLLSQNKATADENVKQRSYECRFVRCKYCGELKAENEMTYIGWDGPNSGECRECIRKGCK